MGIGDFSRLDHLRIAGIGASEADIFSGRTVKKKDLLQYNADLAAQTFHRQIADVVAIKRD